MTVLQTSAHARADLGDRTVDAPVLGMHCAACAARIEKALGEVPGVNEAAVNLATARATVRYDGSTVSAEALRKAVQEQGYDILIPRPEVDWNPDDEAAAAQAGEYRAIRSRFVIAAVLTVPVLVLAMGGHIIPALRSALDFSAHPGSSWH